MAFKTKGLRISDISTICHTDIYGNDCPRPQHALLYSFDARILYQIDSFSVELTPNSILYLPKNSQSHFDIIQSGRMLYIGFELEQDMETSAFVVKCRNERRSNLLFQNIESDFERKGMTYKLLSDLYAVMSAIEHESTMQYVTKTEEQKIGVAMKFIEDNYTNSKLCATDIADSVGLTTAVLRNKFARFCGISPMQYLVTTRMTAAKQLLSESNLAIVDVAKAVGIEDSFYFSRVFKKHCSMTPSEYRRQNKKYP